MSTEQRWKVICKSVKMLRQNEFWLCDSHWEPWYPLWASGYYCLCSTWQTTHHKKLLTVTLAYKFGVCVNLVTQYLVNVTLYSRNCISRLNQFRKLLDKIEFWWITNEITCKNSIRKLTDLFHSGKQVSAFSS
jgi:hypothetical protein